MTIRLEILADSPDDFARDFRALAQLLTAPTVLVESATGAKGFVPTPANQYESGVRSEHTSDSAVEETRAFTPTEIAAAVETIATESGRGRGRPRKNAAAPPAEARAARAEEKRNAATEGRAEAAANALAQEVRADPDGGAFSALLTDDPLTDIPEHLTTDNGADLADLLIPDMQSAPETAVPGTSSATDADLEALLNLEVGEDSSAETEESRYRAKISGLSDDALRQQVMEAAREQGAVKFRRAMEVIKKQKLGDMTRKEMIEVLVLLHFKSS